MGRTPKPPLFGAAWELRGGGSVEVFYILSVFASYSALPAAGASGTGDELSHAFSTLTADKKQHVERLENFPRATQLSSEGTGHQLRLPALSWGARGSLWEGHSMDASVLEFQTLVVPVN